jgi:predicted ATPase
VSFLTERGIVRVNVGALDFDASAVAAALPASVQSLLAARVDRLEPIDRAPLQAASVIGRRFDLQLLAVVVGKTNNFGARLDAMQALDPIHPEGKSGNHVFKHALVREALYQSLLREIRTRLHLKIADEIEHRSSNRVAEVAEVLAHHYSQTDHADKAFIYLSMTGSKSLSVYSLDEAATHFASAHALLDKDPGCASDDQVADFLGSHAQLPRLAGRIKAMIDVLERYMPRIDPPC